MSKKVAVIGGGISGLAAALRLVELDPQVELTLLESQNRLGGVLETVRQDGYLIERGADNFITTMPWGLELVRRLGLEDNLLQTTAQHRTAFVVRRGRLRKIPEGFVIMAPGRIWPVVSTPILSPLGKLRMASEYFLPGRDQQEDESLASFVIRRFGRETYERLVQPLIGGIYTGDPAKLSIRATMPRFVEMEKKHGSLIRAIWKQRKQTTGKQHQGGGARYSMFVALRGGMESLIQAIADRLPESSIRLGTRVTGLRRADQGGWSVQTVEAGSGAESSDTFDEVILAAKANAASALVTPLHEPTGRLLAEIPHASCSIVALGYDREQIPHRLDGFGYVVPQIEQRKTISGSFSSVKYPGRAPDGKVLIRVFIGGERQPELAALPDDQLIEIAQRDLAELLGATGEPQLTLVSRYDQTMPQYYVGHLERIEAVDAAAAQLPGLHFAGNAFGGVGLPFCIHRAGQAAERALGQAAPAAV